MVTGMLKSFLSSFVVVFIMMAILFRSFLWGMLAMLPLNFTITIIYGVIGLIGKDYDMPVAVLSSLTLGLAVDFAIHFLQRSRATMAAIGDWTKTTREMFEEPARAIARNTIVISLGFTPLLFAPLIPYQTVGIFLASIMLYSGLATLWVLPALLTLLQKPLFGSVSSIPAAEDETPAQQDENQKQDNKEKATS
jgi:predicted RND superfamily exporter protein